MLPFSSPTLSGGWGGGGGGGGPAIGGGGGGGGGAVLRPWSSSSLVGGQNVRMSECQDFRTFEGQGVETTGVEAC